jgi:hypothetical protein
VRANADYGKVSRFAMMRNQTMKLYESDHTKFMRELFEKNPKLAEDQKEARAIWWDKKLDRDERKRFKESNVPQKGYVYFGQNNGEKKEPDWGGPD